MMVGIINTPDVSKEIKLKLYYSVEVKHSYVKSASKPIGVSKQYIRRKPRKEKYNRNMIKTTLNKISQIEIDNKINGRGITNKIIYNLQSQIFNHPRVVNSPLKNDHFIIKYHTTGELKKIQKLLIQIPIRELHADCT